MVFPNKPREKNTQQGGVLDNAKKEAMRLTNTTSNRSGTSHWTLEIEANEIGKADFDWEKYAHLRESDDVSDNLYGLALLAEAVEAIKPTCNVPDCGHELLNQGPPPGQWVCPVHSSKGTT